MRVLHVLAELKPSGAERMLACSFDLWRAAGIEPVVVGMSERANPFAARLAEDGYEVILTPEVRSARGLAALRRTMRAVRPELVQIHQESCFDAVAGISRLSPSVRGVVRLVHSSFRFSGLVQARRIARAAVARRLGVLWLACSQEVADTEWQYSRNCVHGVVENWVDVDAIRQEATSENGAHIRAELGIPPEAVVLTLVGNCAWAKNHELVALALARVEEPVVVLHVGSPSHQTEDERRAWIAVPGRHTVHHLGPRADVPRLLAASDLLALPSRYEGMGLVAAEALCARVPVLGNNTVGLRWLGGTEAATLVEPDAGAWASAIERQRRDGCDHAVVEKAARAAWARFNPERGIEEMLAAYETALQTGFFGRPRLLAARAAGARV